MCVCVCVCVCERERERAYNEKRRFGGDVDVPRGLFRGPSDFLLFSFTISTPSIKGNSGNEVGVCKGLTHFCAHRQKEKN